MNDRADFTLDGEMKSSSTESDYIAFFEDIFSEEDDLNPKMHPLKYTINKKEGFHTIVGVINMDPEVLPGEERP